MTLKVKVMLWLGAVFAAFTSAQLVVGPSQRHWAPVALASGVFAFLAFAFEPAQRALLTVPAFILTVTGLNFFWLHRSEPAGIGVLVVTILLNAIVLWIRRRRRQQIDSPA